jgi:Tat protein translocase TatC
MKSDVEGGAKVAEESLEHTRMTLGEHLEELRTRLVHSVLALVVVFVAAWFAHEEIADWLLWPYKITRVKLEQHIFHRCMEELAADPAHVWKTSFEVPDPQGPEDLRDGKRIPESPQGTGSGVGFMFYMRFCFYFALFIAGPYMLWQLWMFIAAGLYKRERRVVYGFLPLSLGLFIGGVLFGFFAILPNALFILASMSVDQIQYWETLDNYSSFLTGLTLATGLVFQLPVLMLVLSRVGLVQPSMYSKYRPHAIVGVVIVAGVATPPDVVSQILMAVPMLVLYEVGYLLARWTVKKQASRREAAAA